MPDTSVQPRQAGGTQTVAISELVQDIIDKRAGRLKRIMQCESHLDQVTESLDALDAMISRMVDRDGNMIPGSPYASLLSSNPGMAAMVAVIDTGACRKAIDEARKKLRDFKLRSSRDGVYISVVGMARIGKSAVLQAFSGLGDHYIPSSSGSDCTGATSIIHNVNRSIPRVTLTFRSREEMVALAQEYLNQIIDDPMKRIHLHSMEEIGALRMDDVRSRMNAGATGGIFILKLGALIEYYREWAPYAGRTDAYVTEDPEEIVTFVAQKDNEGHSYHKYLVVKTCNIECEFPEKGAGKIKLVDTIGLGDNALGIKDSMLKTVRDESDAVIMVIKPQDGAGTGITSSIAKELYTPIYDTCKDRNLNDWLFYLINHVSKTVQKEDVVIPKNTALCEMTRSSIASSGWIGHEPCIVDVMNRDETQSFLNMVLCCLMEKLDSVDDVFRSDAEAALGEAWRTYNGLVGEILHIVNQGITSNTKISQLLLALCNRAWDSQNVVLRTMAVEWRKVRSQPCPGLFSASQKLLNRMMYGWYLPKDPVTDAPDVTEIETALAGRQMSEVIRSYMNDIRTRIKDDFNEVSFVLDRYIDEMKDSVAMTLCDGLSLRRVYPLQEDQPPRSWMTEFAREKLEGFPALRAAVETISGFSFGVKGFLTYEVREALEALDPDLHPVEHVLISKNGGMDRHRTAIAIYDELDRRLVGASKQLKVVIMDMCSKPNRGICAEVEDFVDRMLYAENAELEWKQFYMGEAGILWAREIREHEAASQVSSAWNEMVDRLRKNQSRSRFTLGA